MGYKFVDLLDDNGKPVLDQYGEPVTNKIEVCGKCGKDANECSTVESRYVWGAYFGHYCGDCFDKVATKESFDPDYCGERLDEDY
jgi:hypothetical protein